MSDSGKTWYRLEHDTAHHASLLENTVQSWANPQTDVFLISREGHKVFTNRSDIGEVQEYSIQSKQSIILSLPTFYADIC